MSIRTVLIKSSLVIVAALTLTLSLLAAPSQEAHAYSVKGKIGEKYRSLGGSKGILKQPTSNEICGLRDSGCMQRFQGGYIYWSPKTGAHFVRGKILQKYAAQSWERGALRYPVSDEFCGLRNGGCGQHFQGANGSIYWSTSTGAHIIKGKIKERWATLGWERGKLGYPKTDEFREGSEIRQTFQCGFLAWTGSLVYGEPCV